VGGGGAQSIRRRSFSIYKLALPADKDTYVKWALQAHPYSSNFCCEYTWQKLYCCIVQAAEDAIGHRKQRQPEWFEDNVHALTPYLK